MKKTRIAVVGHVEHVTLGTVDAVPLAGEIAHLRDARVVPGGGGGLALAQLARSDAEVHFFTAIGADQSGKEVRERLAAVRPAAIVHAATRPVPHPHVVVMVDAKGKRTIVVTREPLQPAATDELPWGLLATCDAVYFTGGDPEALVRARAATRLVVTARRRHLLVAAGVRADVAIGSASDVRENAPLGSYEVRPGALVLTDGSSAIRIIRETGVRHVEAPPRVQHPRGDYGAGDTFAAGLTYYLARGHALEEAARRAGPIAAAVLRGIDPLEEQIELRDDAG